MRRIAQKSFVFTLFIFCIVFLIGSKTGITGAVIGIPTLSTPIFAIILMITIFSGTMLFIGQKYSGLEEKIDDAELKSFRRWLEKKQHHKISQNEAAKEYATIKSEYKKAVQNGLIVHGYEEKPLKWIENYASALDSFDDTYKKKYAHFGLEGEGLLRGDTEDNFRQFAGEYFQRLKSGQIEPNTSMDRFVKSYMEERKLDYIVAKHLRQNKATERLLEGQILTKARELLQLATQCGYQLGGNVKEGRQILDDGKILTVIPHHSEVNKNTAKNIMKVYATGFPTFRRQNLKSATA